ncbi:MAG TPA: hypothetical protein VLI06_14070 [Solimonas sp.]|nr:hypothetical protein [Solimonas sp.]
MTTDYNNTPPATGPATPAVAPPALTKNQIKASALADGLAIKAKWKTLIAEARTVWPKVQVEELATVAGNFHVLAGIVQLRYCLSREESNRQVTEFFGKHYPAV